MSESDDETYTIPLVDQRVFGAGLTRKRVQFVPSSSSATTLPTTKDHGQSIHDRYLSMVLEKSPQSPSTESSKPRSTQQDEKLALKQADDTCQICSLPLESDAITSAAPHEASLAHQVCLAHSHPPSAVDRNRKGLSFLQAYGFDPDSRKGLGAAGEGILYPIKVKEKRDRLGVGLKISKNLAMPKKVEKLDAKKVRKVEEEKRKRGERLQQMFYQSDDVERYLQSLQ